MPPHTRQIVTLREARLFLLTEAHHVKRIDGRFEEPGRTLWKRALAIVEQEILASWINIQKQRNEERKKNGY